MNCDEVNDDKMSVISDRCWEEKYKGDSRKWIIRDGTTKNSLAGVSSTMKDNFPTPQPMDEDIAKGIRRCILEKKLYAEVAQEIIEERSRPSPIEEYCTEYDGNYHYPGYDPNKKVERNTELFLKHPLYTSVPATIWKYRLDQQVRGQLSLRGLTEAIDITSPFKRNSEFSKPISEVLDKDSL